MEQNSSRERSQISYLHDSLKSQFDGTTFWCWKAFEYMLILPDWLMLTSPIQRRLEMDRTYNLKVKKISLNNLKTVNT